MLENVYSQLSSLFPSKVVSKTEQLLVQGGFTRISTRIFLGFALFFSACMTALIFFLLSAVNAGAVYQMAAPPAVFLMSAAMFYVLLETTADSRAREIEFILPDALQIISSNIRAGMTLENAVWNAARPEFGAFRDEIKRVSASSFGGTPIQKTLSDMAKRVRSPVLERSVALIVHGIGLGGEMAPLLDEVSKDIRNARQLADEIATATMTYTIFVLMAALVVSPVLFSVTVQYAKMNEKVLYQQQSRPSATQSLTQSAGISGFGRPSIALTSGGIKSESVEAFAIATIAMTAFFAALITEMISRGNFWNGLRFAPLFSIVALAIFYFASFVLASAMGTITR